MPWYILLALVGYSLMLAWHATNVLQLGSRGLVFVPFLLAKLAVLFVALGFWDHDFCSIFPPMVSRLVVAGGASFLFLEARLVFSLTLLVRQHPPEYDNLIIGVELFRIACSAVVLLCAGAVAFTHGCAT